MPVRILTSVDLPAPFSPTSAVTCPAATSRRPSASAWIAPKDLRRPSTDSSMKRCSGDCSRLASEHLGEAVDVRLVEAVGRRHRRLAIGADLDLAHAPGIDRLARLARGLTLDQAIGQIGDGVAEVDGIPDGEGLGRPALDMALHFRGQAE